MFSLASRLPSLLKQGRVLYPVAGAVTAAVGYQTLSKRNENQTQDKEKDQTVDNSKDWSHSTDFTYGGY